MSALPAENGKAQGANLGELSETINDAKNLISTSTNASALDAALDYAQQGLPVFPCNEKKAPRIAGGFKNASVDPDQIRSWWQQWPTALIGIRTGEASDLFVLDVDVKNNAKGAESLGRLIKENGQLPATRVVETRSGGFHYYFKHIPGARNSAGKIADGIDIRTEGGYVIAPPSPGYSFLADTENGPIADAPDWLLRLATPHLSALPAPVIPERQTSAGDVIERARKYLGKMPGGVSGSGGSDPTYAAAAAMAHGFALSESDALGLMLSDYNHKCSPPWTEKELAHKVRDAATKPHNKPKGHLRQALLTTPTSPEVQAELIPLALACKTMPFDSEKMLPADLPDLSAFLNAVAESLQVPRDMVGALIVGLVALAGSRSAEVKCMPGWCEPLTLWLVSLLRPGERKSAAVSTLTRPLNEWAKSERKRLSEPLARFAEKRRGMEQELVALRAGAARPKSDEAGDTMRAKSFDLAAELDDMPASLSAPGLTVHGFTPEALRDALVMNGEKLGIVSAECDAAELMGARYSDSPNIDLLLSAHAGDAITTKRAGGKTIPLERPSVCMVLAVQPEAVRSVLSDNYAKGRGLIDRMLLIRPVSLMGHRHLDPPPTPEPLSRWWSEHIHAILDLPWPGRVIVGHDGDPVRCTSPTRVLPLSNGAHDFLWELRADMERRIEENGDLFAMSGFASKLPGACTRIALAFTLLGDHHAEVVNAEAMRAACAWAPYLLDHRKKILGEAAEPQELHHARRLWDAIGRRGTSTMTKRELFKLIQDSAMPDMKTFDPVLLLMEEHGAISHMDAREQSPGRPSVRYKIHPELLPERSSEKP